jgi:DNA-binding MltR family transcriptional regulator
MQKRVPSTPEELEGSAAEFFGSIKGESDRGCVLVAAAFLDEALEVHLRSRMSREGSVGPLFAGPLRSFWAKIELCRALGLIEGSERDELTRIRKLRNLFAHTHKEASFDHPQVVEITEGFSVFSGLDWRPIEGLAPARQRFVLSASWLAGSLHRRG